MTAKKKCNQKKKKQTQPQPRKQKNTLSLCTQKYILARLNPFDPKAVGSCIPQAASGSTFKFRTTARATITNTDVRGLILLVRPDLSQTHASLQVLVTNQPAGTPLVLSDNCAFKDLIPLNNGINAKGSPFKDEAFTSESLEQRIVGWGIKVTPSGAPLNRQGTMYGYVLPQSKHTFDAATNNPIGEFFDPHLKLQDFMTYPTARWANVGKGESLHLVDHSATTSMQERWYTSHEYRGVGGSSTSGALNSVAAIYLPPDANGAGSFEVEFVAHWELKGRNIIGLQTHNLADPPGYMDALSNIVSQLQAGARRLPPPEVCARYAFQAASFMGYGPARLRERQQRLHY